MRTQMPWWVLVSTGSYLLFEIGWGLYNFNDVPKAYDDLMIVRSFPPMQVLKATLTRPALALPLTSPGHQKRKGLSWLEGRSAGLRDCAYTLGEGWESACLCGPAWTSIACLPCEAHLPSWSGPFHCLARIVNAVFRMRGFVRRQTLYIFRPDLKRAGLTFYSKLRALSCMLAAI